MIKKIKLFSVIFLIFLTFFVYFKFFKIEKIKSNTVTELEIKSYSSNIILDVNYVSQDTKGNIYKIHAKKGEIDLQDPNNIFLTDVEAFIELIEGENIKIKADFGKYNILNYDTIFSKSVLVNYLDNELTGEYLDFSLSNNSMTFSRNVIFKNLTNTLVADNLEMNLKTKDTKINMYENKKKVRITNNN